MSLVADNSMPRPFVLGRFGSIADVGFALLFLLFFSSAFLGPLIEGTPESPSPSWVRVSFYPVYVAILILILRRPLATLQGFGRNALLLLPVLLAFASSFWSLDPAITFRRSVALLMTTSFAIYLASRYDWDDFITLLAATFSVLVVLNFLYILAVPYKGIMQVTHPGAWSGLWWEKNELGMNMAKAAHLCLCAMIIRPRWKWLWGMMLVLASMMVLMSTSKTSLLALLMGLGGVAGLYLFRRGPLIGIPLVFFGVTIVGGVVLAVNMAPEFVFGLLGKDPSLTGRTDIWTVLFEQIGKRPWFGHGYAVFWLDESPPAIEVRQRTQWMVPTAHNGWLETWLSIGLVGVLMFVAIYVLALIAAMRTVLRGPIVYWALISILVFLLFSMSESNIFQQNSLEWIMFSATLAKLYGANPIRRYQNQSAEAVP